MTPPHAALVPKAGVSARRIADFGYGGAGFTVVNDGVMGGESVARLDRGLSGTMIFDGVLSLANGGGFALFSRRIDPVSLSYSEQIEIRLRGDGRVYSLRFRYLHAPAGVSYQARFTTQSGVWQTVALPVREFIASCRGRSVADAGPMAGKDLTEVGVLIAERQEGAFQLEVAWVRSVAAGLPGGV